MTIARTWSVDVVIVGAGLAGLAAADQLTQQGHEVVVLEGRDRVGGRIHTIDIAGVDVDAGATWVAADHTAVRDLLTRLGGHTVPQVPHGKSVVSLSGRRRVASATTLTPWATLDIARIANALQKMADPLPAQEIWTHPRAAQYDAISLGEWLASKRALRTTRTFIGMISIVRLGAPTGELSLLHALRYIKTYGGIRRVLSIDGKPQDRVVGTMHSLVTRLAETLGSRVLIHTPAHRIDSTGDRVTVHAGGETIDARYVIVAAAPAHRAAIQFTPTLPEQHYGLSRSWQPGALSKAFVAYDRPFWRSGGLSGEAVSDDSTVLLTFDVSPDPDGPGILMVFCDPREFDGYNRDERSRRVIRHLAHLYGDQALRITGYEDFAWGNDDFAPGGPTPAVAPKAWTAFGPILREPVGHVHWAGTETADECSGTMNGAILSGQRAAADIHHLLSSPEATDNATSN
jgi:monoamine oxidase